MGDPIAGFGIVESVAFSGDYVLLTKAGADTLVQFEKDRQRRWRFGADGATVIGASVAESDIEFGAI